MTMSNGDSLSIFFLGHRDMRRLANTFLVNLALANLIMVIFNCIPSFLFMRNGNWGFGATACTLSQFSAYFTISLSVFTMVGLNLERYKVIVTPLAPKISYMTKAKYIGIIWLGCCMISILPGYMSAYIQVSR